MEPLPLIAPALALAGSASWLYHQDDTIRELTEKIRIIKERIVIVEKATTEATASLGSPKTKEQGEFTLPDGSLDWKVIGILDKLTSMSPTDLKSLVKALAADTSIKDETKRELIMMSVMMMSSENPKPALAILRESDESLGLEGRNRPMLPMLLSQFAPHEPTAAAEWAETLLPGEDRTNLFKEIHTTLKEKDPEAAATFAEKYQLPIE